MEIFKRKTVMLPALLTPFDARGEIDYGALARLIDRLIGEGADGIYACGSTSEVYLLAREERMRLLEAIVRLTAGRVPVIAHVGSPSQREACALAEHAAACGVCAVSAVPPFYFHYAIGEIKRYYQAVADAAQLPVLLYNIPEFTGVSLNAQNAGDLMADERILGVKHTDYNLYQLQQLKAHFPRKLILNGHEECTIGALALGADGGIGSSFNCIGPLVYRLRDTFEAGDFAGAMILQGRVNAVTAALNAAGGFRAIKYMVKLQGIDCGQCREPFDPISDEGKRIIEAAWEICEKEEAEGA